MSSEDFQITTSLRYDDTLPKIQAAEGTFKPSCFYMLDYHRERMLEASSHFHFSEIPKELSSPDAFESYLVTATQEYQKTFQSSLSQPLKVRILLCKSGRLTTHFSPTEPVNESTLFPSTLPFAGRFNGIFVRHHLDTTPTPLTSHNTFKTTHRPHYETPRARFNLIGYDEPVDVILFSEEGRVLETCSSSIYFKREGRWVTPAVDGEGVRCQMGTTRRWALKEGLAVEGEVDVRSVRDREVVVASNGVRGFRLGVVLLPPKTGGTRI